MRYRSLRLTRGPIARIRLAEAAGRNPPDGALLGELESAAGELHDDASVRVVLLTADGATFAGSLRHAGAAPALPFRFLELLPVPVIACVQGDARGAGLALTLACDVRIVADSARFAFPADGAETWGAAARLPRLIGPGRATELLLLGAEIDARTARDWGLVNAVVAPAELMEAAGRMAGVIAQRGPLAVRYAKEAMLRGMEMPLDQALRYETDLTVILQTTADRAEGVAAFLQKRPPSFEGR